MMNKKIGYGIIASMVFLMLVLSVYQYVIKTRIRVFNENDYIIGDAKVVLEVIECTAKDLKIEGYIEEPESAATVDVGILLNNVNTGISYCIPTEYVELYEEIERSGDNRTTVGFRGRLLWKKLKDNGEEWRVYIIDRNNKNEVMLITDTVISRSTVIE